jgi:hypothetical protein
MLFMGDAPADTGQKFLVRLMRRVLPITPTFHGERFAVRQDAREGSVGRWVLTPLVPALVMVETTDLIFAVDSIPAIFAITADPFLVFTSNVFAILGLRSLYFALAGALHALPYVKHALAAVLLMVGVKMLAHSWLEHALGPNFNLYMLAAVIAILASGVLASLIQLRWRDRIRTAVGAVVHRVTQWVVPDRLVSTITEEAEREIARRAAAAEHRSRQPSPARVGLAGLWHRFLRRTSGKLPILVIHQVVEESEAYAVYLSGMMA